MTQNSSSRLANSASKRSAQHFDGHSIHNEILLGLPKSECDSLFSHLEFVELQTHAELQEMGEPIKYAYFMNSGLASILTVMGDGKSVEVGLAGKEGFVGVPLAAGFASSPTRVVAQVSGSAFKVSAANLLDLLRRCPQLEKQLHRFSQTLGLQATQVAACNRLHEVEERLARWLLMSQDRIGGDIVPLTQEFLAHMLGTRRASVTVAAGILQKAGLITYDRGKVKILNRDKLETAACECYETMSRMSRNWERESQ